MPSERECLAAIYRVEGATKTEALIRAGYSPETARARQRDFFDRPLVRETMQEALAMARVTPELIAEILLDGLTATEAASAKGRSRANYIRRLRYLEVALEVYR